MTILAAIVGKDKVFMATDSQVSWGDSYTRQFNKAGKFIETPEKDLLIATCGSIKNEQILKHVLNLEENKYLLDAKDYKGMRKWSAALKEAMAEWGVGDPKDNEVPSHDHGFLVARKGVKKVWEIDCDYAIIEYDDYAVSGSGYRYADGAIQVLQNYDCSEPEILKQALKTAIARDPYCGGKIHIRSV